MRVITFPVLLALLLLVSTGGLGASEKPTPQWYVLVNDHAVGPVSLEQLRQMSLGSDSLVAPVGESKWLKAGSIPELLSDTDVPLNIPDPDTPVRRNKRKVIPYRVINPNNPGHRLDIRRYIVAGKYTVFDMYSEYCPPCRAIAPKLQQLAMKRPDIVVRKVDINRKGVKGIDWESPLAKQYSLYSIPHFIIYKPDRTMLGQGQPAYEQVFRWFKESGISFR